MSGLVLTETDRNLWAVFCQEQSLVGTACKERLRWSNEMVDNRQRRRILRVAGSARAELIHTVAMAWGAACWGQPGGSRHIAACQKHINSNTHTPLNKQPIQWLCHDVTIQQEFLSRKLKAALLRQQPQKTFDSAAADASVCFLINKAD